MQNENLLLTVQVTGFPVRSGEIWLFQDDVNAISHDSVSVSKECRGIGKGFITSTAIKSVCKSFAVLLRLLKNKKMVLELNDFNFTIIDDFYEESEQCSHDIGTIAAAGNVVKHTLKSKILERRKNLGLGNITVDFSSKKPYPMTEEEIEKDKKRKQSNRASAYRCRQKQKEEDKRNRNLLAQLKEDHEELLNKVKEREEEKNHLLFALKNVLPDSYILEALKRIDKHEINNNGNICRKADSKPNTHAHPVEIQNDKTITNDFILDENYIFEDDSSATEILLSSLINSSEGERPVIESVDILETETEDSLQLFFLQ